MTGSQKRDGWKDPLPEHVARPTYWPAMLALGIIVALLGPVTNMAVTIVGLVFGAVALAGWIGELLHG
jgi:hypothetical protein